MCFHLLENYSLGDLFSSKTMIPSTQLKPHSNGLKTTRWMFWSGQVKAQTSIRQRICSRTWNGLFTPDPHAPWQSLNSSERKNRVKLQCLDEPTWLRPIYTAFVLWLQPKVHLLNTDLKLTWNVFILLFIHLTFNVKSAAIKEEICFVLLFGRKCQIMFK